LLRYSGHWELLGFGYWVLEVKATGEFVGEVGFSDYKRDLEPPSKDVPEVGWVLTPAKQGMGYATEAVKAALKWGYRYFGEKPVACLIDPGHEVSIRVAEKCGFKERRTCLYQGKRVLLFERILGR
jgi:RimJ/RimL family protein N-acetyltransferase